MVPRHPGEAESSRPVRKVSPTAPATTRRAFLRATATACIEGGALLLASGVLRRRAAAGEGSGDGAGGREDSGGAPALRIGLVTDIHYADKEALGSRVYRESIPKMKEAVARFREEKCDLAVELGDLVDSAEKAAEELRYLRAIEAEYAALGGERHHVLGNHCVWTLTKKEFLETVGQSASHFAVDRGGFRLVVLDACFRKDGVAYGARNFAWNDSEIPEAERAWLAESLEASSLPAVVFVHQRLDVTGDYAVRSAPAVREILERSGKVLAVFQGHFHENDYREIRGIHYVTLAAMVEGAGAEHNAYGILDLHADGSMRLRGFRRQASREAGAGPRARRRSARV